MYLVLHAVVHIVAVVSGVLVDNYLVRQLHRESVPVNRYLFNVVSAFDAYSLRDG